MSAPPPGAPVVTLYTRPGCTPCGLVADALDYLRPRFPHTLHVVDVSSDPAAEAALGNLIPVVEIGDRRLTPPVTIARLIAALSEAAAG